MPNNQQLVDFVRGMRWHDIAKPLFLASDKHARFGYALWQAFDSPSKALVALAHHRIEEQLEVHFAATGDADLPAYLALGNALDRLTATTYAVEEDEPDQSPENPSSQNPFSRLPAYSDLLTRPLSVTGSSGNLSKNVFLEDFYKCLETQLGTNPVNKLKSRVNRQLFSRVRPRSVFDICQILQDDQLDRQELLTRLKAYFRTFAERTYPTPNDTSLDEHCRLSAAMAFVVYKNLWASHEADWLDQRISRNAAGKIHLNGDEKPWKQGEQIVTRHLDCNLVRIVFSGFQQLFENAPRLDDLLGVREIVGTAAHSATEQDNHEPTLKQALREAFARELDVPDLEDILVLREGPFDLVYLMPHTIGRDELQTKVATVYDHAIERIIKERVLDVMADDFDEISELRIRDGVDELIEQWQALPLSWSVHEIRNPTPNAELKDAAKQFARLLLDAYRKAQAGASIIWTPRLREYMAEQEASQVAGACEVCGMNPQYPEFIALLDKNPRDLPEGERETLKAKQATLKKVVREFRDRPERLCRSCVAVRVMSHKKGGVEALQETMEKLIEDWGDSAFVPARREGDEFPDVPPLMRTGEITVEGGEYKELGAAFVRRRYDSADLERFPTISYAADRNSNVALIALRPVKERIVEDDEGPVPVGGVFGRYDYSDAIDLAPNDSLDGKNFEKYYQSPIVDGPAYQEAERAEPHIARALQRMTWIQQRFYDELQGDLENPGRLAEDPGVLMKAVRDIKGIRVLPIQTEYPRALFVVPADRLLDVMHVLHVSATYRLFSSQLYAEEEAQSLSLLETALPPVLLGAGAVFKHKQPLYVVMEAVENMLDVLDRKHQRDKLEPWGGVLFGFGDLRGVLSERELIQARSPFVEAYDVVEFSRSVDRRSLLSTNALLLGEELSENESLPARAGASLYIRGDRQGWNERILDLLQKNRYFKPVVFLRRMAR